MLSLVKVDQNILLHNEYFLGKLLFVGVGLKAGFLHLIVFSVPLLKGIV